MSNLKKTAGILAASLAGAAVLGLISVAAEEIESEASVMVESSSGRPVYHALDYVELGVYKGLSLTAEQGGDGTVLTEQINEELMTQLYNTCKVTEYPDNLVSYSVSRMNDFYQDYADSFNMTLEEFLGSQLGMEQDAYTVLVEDIVRKSLQQEMILTAIAEEEGLTITDDEYSAGCADYAANLGYDDIDGMIADYGEDMIRTGLLMDEAMKVVFDNAVIAAEEDATEDIQ